MWIPSRATEFQRSEAKPDQIKFGFHICDCKIVDLKRKNISYRKLLLATTYFALRISYRQYTGFSEIWQISKTREKKTYNPENLSDDAVGIREDDMQMHCTK